MKKISFEDLGKKKKKRCNIIWCSKPVFKPMLIFLSIGVFLFVLNLFVFDFFANINASIQNFVQSFVRYFLRIL